MDMTIINNHTGVPHFWFEKAGPAGEPLDILVVRATFDLAANGDPMSLADEQSPIVFGDAFAGPVQSNPLHAIVKEDGDLLPYKPGTDLLVLGNAHAPGGRPRADWLAGLRVGHVRKMLRLHGPRQFRKGWLGWRLAAASPVAHVPLDYRLAYGGCIDIPAELTPDGEPDAVKHSANPAGCGWLPSRAMLRQLSKPARRHVDAWICAQQTLQAPQIESVTAPIKHPQQHVAAQGFGPLARWWMPRAAYQGSYDDHWRHTRYPLLPADFDARFYQSAPSDLVATPHLRGDESVTLLGLLPERVEMRLPGWTILAAVRHASGEHTVSLPVLDTVRFDLDRRQASLVWRVHFRRDDAAVEISLAATTCAVTGQFAQSEGR